MLVFFCIRFNLIYEIHENFEALIFFKTIFALID